MTQVLEGLFYLLVSMSACARPLDQRKNERHLKFVYIKSFFFEKVSLTGGGLENLSCHVDFRINFDAHLRHLKYMWQNWPVEIGYKAARQKK